MGDRGQDTGQDKPTHGRELHISGGEWNSWMLKVYKHSLGHRYLSDLEETAFDRVGPCVRGWKRLEINTWHNFTEVNRGKEPTLTLEKVF